MSNAEKTPDFFNERPSRYSVLALLTFLGLSTLLMFILDTTKVTPFMVYYFISTIVCFIFVVQIPSTMGPINNIMGSVLASMGVGWVFAPIFTVRWIINMANEHMKR